MTHTAEEMLTKWAGAAAQVRDGTRRGATARAFLECYDVLAGLRPEAVREMILAGCKMHLILGSLLVHSDQHIEACRQEWAEALAAVESEE